MQGISSRSKTTLAVIAGVVSGTGLALLAFKVAPRVLWRRLNSSSNTTLWDMTIKVASNEAQCVTLVNELNSHIKEYKVVGFDCEWVQIENKRNPVALLQLATQEGLCGLFQLQCYSSFPQNLQDLLQDKTILKVGVAPNQDAKYLFKDYNIQVSGTVDIRHLVDPAPGKDTVGGLASIVHSELGVRLPKKFKVRVSNWEAKDLTLEQQEYSANDALGSLLAFNKLISKRVKVPFFYSKTSQWQKIFDYCTPLLDKKFLEKGQLIQFPLRVSTAADSQLPQPLERQKSGQPHASTPSTPSKRSYRAVCPRRSPLYENAFMLAPDGVVLCTCDSKKADWYVSKGLATVVEQEPLRIQLTFEPSGRAKGTSAEYYTLEKQNQCVACGRKDSYVRKKVVPHEYRRYFPDCMKKHQSHDVLLLCTSCHSQSNISDLNLRIKLAQLCNAPIASDENVKLHEDFKNKSLRSAARALLNSSHQLPEDRQQELIDFIQEQCQSPVTPDLLNYLKDIDIMVANKDYSPHGLLVVKYFSKDGIQGIMKLEKLWREHFVNFMQPKFLPPLWSIDHYHENERDFTLDPEFLRRIEALQA